MADLVGFTKWMFKFCIGAVIAVVMVAVTVTVLFGLAPLMLVALFG
jgi:hypothetical protein